MSIVSGMGIGSGLDINGLVQQLVQLEGAASKNAIMRRESQANIRLSALGKLKSALNEFNTAANTLKKESAFTQYTANSSDESLLTAQANSNAVSGQYNIEISNLATRHKLISKGYNDSAEAVGKGTLILGMGSESFALTIDDTNNTLAGLRDAINDAQDNPGIQASIIQVDDGAGGKESKLILNGRDTGSANQLTITANEDAGAPGLANFVYDPDGSGVTNLTEQVQAQDASILVDGQMVTSSSNTLTNVIEGITLDLNAEKPGTIINLDVALDEESIKDKVNNFVSSYNELMTQVNSLQKVDPNMKSMHDDGSFKRDSGPLVGDALLRNATSQIRSVLSQPVEGVAEEVNSLAMVGISIDRNGVMSLNESDFTGALASNFNGVKTLFSSSEGVAKKLDERINPYLMSDGMIEQQTNSIDKQLKRLDIDRQNLDRRLEQVEERLTKQFIAMDKVVGQLSSLSNYLTQNLTNLNN